MKSAALEFLRKTKVPKVKKMSTFNAEDSEIELKLVHLVKLLKYR